MTIAENECKTLKEEVTKVTGVVVQYTQEWKYYTNIIETIKKEIETAEKSKVKTAEEDKDEDDDDKKKDEKKEDEKEGEEKDEKKEKKKETKEKPTKSSTSNEVKQIEK